MTMILVNKDRLDCGAALDPKPRGERVGINSSQPIRSFTCPLPPSINKAYKNTKWGRSLTNAARVWKDAALSNLKSQHIEPILGNCVIVYGFERKSLAADCSNRLKLLEDSIVEAGIIEDDRFVTASAISWIPYANELAHISIYPIGPIGLTLMPASDGATAAWVPTASPQLNESENGYVDNIS